MEASSQENIMPILPTLESLEFPIPKIEKINKKPLLSSFKYGFIFGESPLKLKIDITSSVAGIVIEMRVISNSLDILATDHITVNMIDGKYVAKSIIKNNAELKGLAVELQKASQKLIQVCAHGLGSPITQ